VPSIDARITKIELDQNTGWYRIHTDDERVQRVETKRRDLADEAEKIMQSRVPARVEFTEREGNLNSHTGKPYINRYFEKATPLGDSAPPASSGIEVVQQTGRKTDPGDAWRICLAAGGKLAVATLPMMPVAQRDFGTQKQIALAWAEFFFFSIAPSQPALNGAGVSSSQFQRPADAQPSTGPGAYSDAPPPHDDNDIPF
jgi:hypothetical protein